jgi:hypothetical protein
VIYEGRPFVQEPAYYNLERCENEYEKDGSTICDSPSEERTDFVVPMITVITCKSCPLYWVETFPSGGVENLSTTLIVYDLTIPADADSDCGDHVAGCEVRGYMGYERVLVNPPPGSRYYVKVKGNAGVVGVGGLPDARWIPTGPYGIRVSKTSRSDVPSKGMPASPDEFEPDPGASATRPCSFAALRRGRDSSCTAARSRPTELGLACLLVATGSAARARGRFCASLRDKHTLPWFAGASRACGSERCG